MTSEMAKEFVTRFEALTGKEVGTNEVRRIWYEYIEGIGGELASRALLYLQSKEDGGFTIRNRPNLSSFQSAVRHLASQSNMKSTTFSSSNGDYPDCSWCNRSGLVYVVYAGPTYDTMRVRRRDDRVNWFAMSVLTVPCLCEAGNFQAKRECFNLSDRARHQILEHCAMPYRQDILTIISECRKLKTEEVR